MESTAENKQWKLPTEEDTKKCYVNMEVKFPDDDRIGVHDYYDTWSETYNSDVSKLKYNVPETIAKVADKLAGQDDKPNWKALDIGSGTGLIGLALRKHGFSGDFSALDYSKNMLEISKSSDNVYKNFYNHCLTESSPLPFEDNSFDLAVSGGSFGPDTIQPACFKDVFRTLRPGGYLVLTSRISKVVTPFNESLCAELDRLARDEIIGKVTKEVFDQYEWDVSDTRKERIQAILLYCKKL